MKELISYLFIVLDCLIYLSCVPDYAFIHTAYSDYEHYPNLKGFYTTTNSYLDAIETFKMSFNAYKDLHTQYEKEARDYKADLDYIFEDSVW